MRLATLLFTATLGTAMFSTVAAADPPESVLHEYLAPDSNDLARTDASGAFPEAVQTHSGPIKPPDLRTSPLPNRIYQKGANAASGFRPDRDTSRPHVEQYDDPFTPTLTPFKRMYAYDSVREDYSLYVKNENLADVPTSTDPGEQDDRFFGDMMVATRANEPVRIPTIGPGARLLRMVTVPETSDLTLQTDGAGNWFAESDTTGQVRLVIDVVIERSIFGSEYPDVRWSELHHFGDPPASQRSAFLKVAKAIGISRQQSPREVVTKMVTYFRSFAPSNDSPASQGDIYLDLALSKKGVCRHRSFAFLVTALHMGIPTRLVHNEAHAWVEVMDNRIWHRIDLGGAALDLDQDPHLERPPHVPPPDSFQWPTGRDSGADLAHRDREDAIESQGDQTDPNGQSVDPFAPGEPDPNAPNPAKDMPETELKIDDVDRDIFRGLPVKIRGTATSKGNPCAHLRVDVFLLMDGSTKQRLGSLSTDEQGNYAGEVVMPPNIPIGDHELVVATPGANKCGPGQAR